MMASTNLLEADLVNADKQIRVRLGISNENQTKRNSLVSSIENLKYHTGEPYEADNNQHQSSISQRSQ